MKPEEFFTEYKNKNNIDEKINFKKVVKLGNSKEENEKLLSLILEEKKKAITSLLTLYEREEIPEENDYIILTNFDDEPKIIVRNNKVRLALFRNVSLDLVLLEGEEKNLASWQMKNIEKFTNILKEKNINFDLSNSVIFEAFDIVYKED